MKRSFRGTLLQWCGALALVTSANGSASAAIVAYNDFAAFSAAATGTSATITFDSLIPGATLSSVGDVDFFLDDMFESLTVLNTFPETLSAPNYIGDTGMSFPGEQLDEAQAVTILFNNPRSAVGLWVQFDPQLAGNDGTLTLQEINDPFATEANVDRFNGTLLDANSPGATDEAFFIGLVDNTGMNTLTEFDLFVSDFGTIGYTFDNVVSYQVIAIPEPSTWAMLAMVGGGIVYRRRRSK